MKKGSSAQITTKPSEATPGSSFFEEFKMTTHLFSSWEIMPQTIMVSTGDIHVDGALAAILAIVWLIRTLK